MITLSWSFMPGSDVMAVKVYRSIVGALIPLPGPGVQLLGETLKIRSDMGFVQTHMFDTNDILSEINANFEGVHAYSSQVPGAQYIILRNNARSAPGSLEIYGGSALELLGVSARTIREGSESHLVATISELPMLSDSIQYSDPDGSIFDLYSLSTVDSNGIESERTSFQRSRQFVGKVCVIEGFVYDIQGIRTPDVKVSVKPLSYPQSSERSGYFTAGAVETVTDARGRFSIPLIQGAKVQIDIPEISYSKIISVPEKTFEFITSIPSDYDHHFASEGKGI